MKTFFKANMASIIASFCDYMVTIVCKQFLYIDAVIASVTGTIFGGIINFYICRRWVFNAKVVPLAKQGRRYFLIWSGNLVMNGGGVYLLIHFAGMNYIIAKVITSLAVSVGYNYPLQKLYVFKNNLYMQKDGFK